MRRGTSKELDTTRNDIFYLFNGHGDVTALTDKNGTVTKTYEYDAFGNEINPSENDTNPFRYCGEYYDSETGSIYLRARNYSPTTGRFTTEDPIKDGLNWYAYCGGNPVVFVDPLGLYDRELAVKYAQIYGQTGRRNPNYDDYENNCANFVSQCLYSGGISQTKDWYSTAKGSVSNIANSIAVAAKNFVKNAQSILNGNEKTDSVREKRTSSSTWISAQAQFEYFSDNEKGYVADCFMILNNDQLGAILYYSEIQPGDLLYWGDSTSYNLDITHASIITEIKNNDIYFAGNTTDRCGGSNDSVKQTIDWKTQYLVVVRINDDAN